METTVHCAPQEFCMYQKEDGGGISLRFYCMANMCRTPEKKCLFRRQPL